MSILLGKELNIIYDSQAHELLLPYFVMKKAIESCLTEKPDNWFDSPQGETLWISQTSEHDFPEFNVVKEFIT